MGTSGGEVMLTEWLWFLAAFLVFDVIAAALAIWAIKHMHDRDMAEFAARCDPANISDKEGT